jgi:ferric-dicitrate binding protein FerR (iron transport regulator)
MSENNEEQVAKLLRLAGRRPAVDAERTARVRAAVHEEWVRESAGRQRKRWLLAAAAAVIIGIVALFTFRPATQPVAPMQPVPVVATIEGAGRSLRAGEVLETTGDTASTRWGEATLRLDTGSSVRFVSDRELSLERGAIYFAGSGSGVVIRTPYGIVHDIGTRFEVRLSASDMKVRVREGRVDLERNGSRRIAGAGTELSADAAGSITMRSIAPDAAEWEWVLRAAPPMTLEGKTLGHIVESVASERGLGVRWPGDVSRDIELHGSTPLPPAEALDAALAAAGLESRVEKGRLIVVRSR